jgi:lipoprotein signal peptidase
VERHLRALALVAVLVAGDLYAKAHLNGFLGDHRVDDGWLLHTGALAVLTVPLTFHPRTRAVAVLALAGLMGNYVSVATSGAAANPLLISYGGTIKAFNLADVYLFLAFLVGLYVTVTWTASVLHTFMQRERDHAP